MKHLTITLLALLLVAFSVIAADASIIYQDDFQVNDFASRYTNYTIGGGSWWTYDDLGGGNTGLAPAAYWWSSLLDTKDYLNGHFTNTSYSARIALKCFPVATNSFIGFVLLNNGHVVSSSDNYGYKAELTNSNGAVFLLLTRINSDGSGTSLFDNWATPFTGGDLSQWSNLTATVDVQPTETYLKLEWTGVDGNGNSSSYSCDYHDTSAQRWTSGTGIGLDGYCGNNAPATSAIVIDDLVVSTVPEPASFVAFACGLVSLLGMRRRRA